MDQLPLDIRVSDDVNIFKTRVKKFEFLVISKWFIYFDVFFFFLYCVFIYFKVICFYMGSGTPLHFILWFLTIKCNKVK